MKNNVKRIICIVAAVATVMSMYGCGNKETTSNKKDDTEGKTINYSELETENGTAVYTYKYTDDSGKEQTQKVDIDMDMVDDINFVAENRDISSEKFVSVIAQKGYQMTEDEAKKVAENPDDYKEFQLLEYVQNSSDKTMAYKKIVVADNGENGIWLKTTLDAEFTIAPGAIQPVYIYGIADMKKCDEEKVEEVFKATKIQLEYVLIDNAQDDIDWDAGNIKTMDIH